MLFEGDTAPAGAASVLAHGLSVTFVVSAIIGMIALKFAFDILVNHRQVP